VRDWTVKVWKGGVNPPHSREDYKCTQERSSPSTVHWRLPIRDLLSAPSVCQPPAAAMPIVPLKQGRAGLSGLTVTNPLALPGELPDRGFTSRLLKERNTSPSDTQLRSVKEGIRQTCISDIAPSRSAIGARKRAAPAGLGEGGPRRGVRCERSPVVGGFIHVFACCVKE
jgi:hypothetical protein